MKEAVHAAFGAYMEDPVTQFYAIGSRRRSAPFPAMVRDFQAVVGREPREQFKEMTGGNLPDNLVACVGRGRNAIGLFSAFLDDAGVRDVRGWSRRHGPERRRASTRRRSPSAPRASSTGSSGRPPARTKGRAREQANTVASGLDYPGSGSAALFPEGLGSRFLRNRRRRRRRGVHGARETRSSSPRWSPRTPWRTPCGSRRSRKRRQSW